MDSGITEIDIMESILTEIYITNKESDNNMEKEVAITESDITR